MMEWVGFARGRTRVTNVVLGVKTKIMGKKFRKGDGLVQKKGSLKRQIRDTERLLSREGLPETVRQTKERVLKSLKKEISKQAMEKKTRKLAKQYKMVKFFDKTKVLRKLKSAVRERDSCTDESERTDLEEAISRLRMELNYILHYPMGCKYVSLYPSTTISSDEAITRRDALLVEIWERVTTGDLPDASKAIGGVDHLPSESASHSIDTIVDLPQSTGSESCSTRWSLCNEKDSESGSDMESKTIRDDFFLDVTGNFDQLN